MTMPAEKTILILDGMGVPLYSHRGLQEKLTMIDGAAQIERDCDGAPIDLSATQFRKYRLVLSCVDRRAPNLGGVWPGFTVQIYPVTRLSRPVGFPSDRAVLGGSEITEGGNISYRIILDMILMPDWSITTDEYKADVQWQKVFEEV